MTAGVINWVVVVGYFALTLWLGERLGRGQHDLEDYFLAGRRMPWWSTCLSIVGTETSTLTFVGVPALAYTGDLTFLQLAAGYVIGRLLVAWWLVPAYFTGRVETAYQLLARQFGDRVQSLAALVFLVTRTLADGVRLFATALVLQAVLPMPLWLAIVAVAGVTCLYTLRGGLRAVIWNDSAQLAVYLGGATLALALLAARAPDGMAASLEMLRQAGKLRLIDLSLDLSTPYSLLSGLVGGAVLTMATHGTDQMFVQRLLACGSVADARRAIAGSGVLVFFQMALFLAIGSLLYAFYAAAPPEMPADQIFPHFIATQMPPGIGGLLVAAVFAAAMSTLSSSMSSLASSSTFDLWLRGRRRSAVATARALQVSRLSTLVWAVALAVVAAIARSWGSVLEAGLTITSITFGGVLGVFLIGALGWRLSDRAAATCLVVGLVAGVLGQQADAVAWTWLTPLGAGATLSCGVMLRQRARK